METRDIDVRRVLFVGTGGGTDAFSVVLAAMSLRRLGWKWDACDFACVLNPFRSYEFGTEQRMPMGSHVIVPGSRKFAWRRDMPKELSFVNAAVSQMVASEGIFGVERVYGLTLEGGTEYLSHAFRGFRRTHDLIVLVDIGGDILYRGAEDTHILSPMYDAMCLQAFRESGMPGILFEAGPGTDGEMDPEALIAAISATDHEAHLLHEEDVDMTEVLYDLWIRSVRAGRTMPMLFRAFRSSEDTLVEKYSARMRFGDVRRFRYFDQRIDTELCRNFFLIDPATVANPFALRCFSPLDWYAKTQVAQHRTNCEADMEFCWHEDSAGGGRLIQFLTPSPMFPATVRREMIGRALSAQTEIGTCDEQFMFPEDWGAHGRKWRSELRGEHQPATGLVSVTRRPAA